VAHVVDPAVGGAVDEVRAGQYLAFEVGVVGVDPRVEHGDGDALAGRLLPCVADAQEAQLPLLRADRVGVRRLRGHEECCRGYEEQCDEHAKAPDTGVPK
jgi:hypothetical protein